MSRSRATSGLGRRSQVDRRRGRVERITYERVPCDRQMDPDLVGAPGLDLDLEERVRGATLEHAHVAPSRRRSTSIDVPYGHSR
jgi:hypothetical protein